MKNALAILLTLICLQLSAQKPRADVLVKIKSVEKGLITPVFIEGDPTWTIEERMEHYGVPGVSIAVISNGKIAWTKTYGVVDKQTKEPVTEKTLFQAASISKPVSAYGALTLVEKRKLGLEDDINSILKSWKLTENEFTKEKKVTIKNLLNHTAGITVHGFWGYYPGLPVPTLLQVLDGAPPANSDAAVVDKVPEESFRYSGGGYNIIQQMMIDVEGKAFPELMDGLVLKPLEMNSSTFSQPLPEELLPLAATGYLPNGSMTRGKRHTYPEMAPAGLWTIPSDLAKFAINIQETLKGKSEKVLSQEMTTTMLTPFVEEFAGLGVFFKKKNEEIYFEHSGWNEGFSSKMVAHRDKDYGVVVMINSNHPDFISELIGSVALVYEWDEFVPSYSKLEIDPTFVIAISGRYRVNGNTVIEIVQKDDKLLAIQLGSDPVELVRISDKAFARRDVDQLIEFRPNLKTSTMNMVGLDSKDGTVISTFPKMKPAERTPLELLIEDRFDEALEAYQELMKEDPKNPTSDEDNLNSLGYEFLEREQNMVAHDIFKVNMMLYPESSNVYDSYAEACMIMGKNKLAIEYYTKSLELDSGNSNAEAMIKKMQKSK